MEDCSPVANGEPFSQAGLLGGGRLGGRSRGIKGAGFLPQMMGRHGRCFKVNLIFY